MKPFIGLVCVILSVVFAVILIFSGLSAAARWSRMCGSHWDLADRASTLEAKQQHIQDYVGALEKLGLEGSHNALIYHTPSNSFDANLEALKTLQRRLGEIQTMDPTSFQYQTAIQQITGQEFGEAHDMTAVFRGSWYLHTYPLLWNWLAGVVITLVILLFFVGLIVLVQDL